MMNVEDEKFRMRNLTGFSKFRMGNSAYGMICGMTKDDSMRKLLADKVRLWMTRVPEANTQAKLSVRAKMSQSSVHRVIFMDTEPELATAYKLANAFGITVSELLAEDDDGQAQGALPFDIGRYARLPESEKQKIKAFAEFVIATHAAGSESSATLESVSEIINPNPDERALVGRVARRNLTTDTLSTNEPTKDHQQKATRKRPKSAGN